MRRAFIFSLFIFFIIYSPSYAGSVKYVPFGVKAPAGGAGGGIALEASDSAAMDSTQDQDVAFTVSSASNSVLVVVLTYEYGGASGTVYWNTTEQLTEAVNVANIANEVSIFYLVNPTAATDNVNVQMSATSVPGGIHIYHLSGVTQGAPEDTNSATAGSTDTISVTENASGTANRMIISGVCTSDATTDITPGTGQINQLEVDDVNMTGSADTEIIAGTGAATQQETAAASQTRLAMAIASFAPAP